MDRRKFLIGAAGLPLASAFPAPALTQGAWPTRTITMVVPLAPGGTADLAARPVAAALEKILERPVIVENRTGAGGAIGNASVAKAEPDGYTVLMTISSFVVLPEADRLFDRKPLYETDQFIPIARVLADPSILAVHASTPWKTLKDFVDDAKKRPGAIAYGSSGNYGAAHVSMELLANAAGVKFLHVPYRGGGPALTGLIGNQVVATALGRGALAPHVQAGTIRLLASWGDQREPELPDVPTLRELGYPAAEFYVWAGLFAPKGTPDPIITRLRDAMRQAMTSAQVKTIFEKAGTAAAYLDGPDFARFMQGDSARLIPAVKKIGKVE